MTKIAIKRVWRAALCALALAGAGAAAHAGAVRVGGTGAALGGMHLLAQAYEAAHPGAAVIVLPSLGSSGGIKALAAGAIDVAIASRPPKARENASGVLHARRYARTPLAIATSQSNSAEAITAEQLQAAYSGTMLNWPDGARIRVLLRPPSESDVELMRDVSPEMAAALDAAYALPGILMAQNDQDNAEALEHTSGSLGVIALAQVVSERRKLKVLAFNGEMPRADMAGDPAFQFARDFYIIARRDASDTVRGFLDFARSADGRRVLDENAHFTFD